MKSRYNKETIINFADRLGYKLELIGVNNRIYLIKDDVRLFRNSYIKTYQYLYGIERKIKKQVS